MGQDNQQLVGIVLIAVGVLDPVVGALLVAPRIADPGRRRIVVLAIVGGGLALVGLGVALLSGAL